MKGRKKLPDNIKALRGMDQPCRMSDTAAVQTSTIVKATDLKNYLTPYRNSISYELKGGTMKPLSSDYGTHDGLSPSCAIIGKLHANIELLDKMCNTLFGYAEKIANIQKEVHELDELIKNPTRA